MCGHCDSLAVSHHGFRQFEGNRALFVFCAVPFKKHPIAFVSFRNVFAMLVLVSLFLSDTFVYDVSVVVNTVQNNIAFSFVPPLWLLYCIAVKFHVLQAKSGLLEQISDKVVYVVVL